MLGGLAALRRHLEVEVDARARDVSLAVGQEQVDLHAFDRTSAEIVHDPARDAQVERQLQPVEVRDRGDGAVLRAAAELREAVVTLARQLRLPLAREALHRPPAQQGWRGLRSRLRGSVRRGRAVAPRVDEALPRVRQVAHGPRDLRIDGVLLAAGRGGMVRLVEDQQ